MKLILYYFSIPFWRAEVTRLALYMNDIEFVDHRISDTERDQFKKNGQLPNGMIAPFRQLPVLEVDGKIVAQTGAIARFCGKLSGMYPSDNDFDAARVDQIIEAAQDINYIVSISGREKNPEKKLLARERLTKVHLPKWLLFLENLLIENNESDWFVGNSMTIADLAIWRLIGWLTSGLLDGVPESVLDPYKNLVELKNKTSQHPKIKEWMLMKYGKEI
jgi:glutathione S-transferase